MGIHASIIARISQEARYVQPVSRFWILGAALLFSTGGIAIKATTLSAWQVSCFRSGIAAFALWVLVPGWRRWWGPRQLLVGGAYAATMTLFVAANKLTTAANTIFLQGTAPLYVLLLAPWLLREPNRARDLASVSYTHLPLPTILLV